ncbi:MAG: DUF4302 domain-containing protein [Prevotella sp.]|nr:DUF4302 domain-containing protein [Prevotella sp.]
MKKIYVPLIISAVTALTLTGCAGEEDDIFDKTAAERLNESSSKYSARLEAQPNGWAMQYYPTYSDMSPQGSGYLILMDFNPDNSVKVAMNNRFSNNQYWTDTSVWEVIKDNGPVLSFNSYNTCMHAFSDPEDITWTADNEQSEGCGGDYEFIIVDAPEDASYMMLKGKKRNTYNLLTPIEEGVDYEQYLTDVNAFHNKIFSASAPTGCYLCFGPDSIYNMEDGNDGVPNIYPKGTDSIANESFHPFLITKRGNDYYLRFRDAFKRDFMEGTLQELKYDSIQDCFFGTDNPDFVMIGYPAEQFFQEYSDAKGDHKFDFNVDNEMSDKFQTYITSLVDDFSSMKSKKNKAYSFLGLRFTWNAKNESFQWNLRYTPGTSSATLAGYNYTYEMDGNRVKFTYVAPGVDAKGSDAATTNIRNALPSVVTITELLSQEFTITPANTNFNLSKLKFTAVNDPELWFIVTI